MKDVRIRARLILAVALLLANGWAALMLYTFFAADRVTAHVTGCTNGRRTVCTGTWTGPGGIRGTGTVNGVGRDAVGTDVPVRLGPIGAYVDDPVALGTRLIFPAVVDVTLLVIGPRLLRLRSRAVAASRGLLTEPGAAYLVLADATGLRDPGGRHLAGVRPGPGGPVQPVCDPTGAPMLALDRSDPGYGEPYLSVYLGNGAPAGTVRREHPGVQHRFALVDPAGRPLAWAATPGAWSGGAYTVRTPDGLAVARIGYLGRDGWVVRLDRPVPDPLRTLVLALGMDVQRMITTRTNRQTSALGRGWQA